MPMLRGRVLHIERTQCRAHVAADSRDAVLQRAAEQGNPALAAEHQPRPLARRRTTRELFAIKLEFALSLCHLVGLGLPRPLLLRSHALNGERRSFAPWIASSSINQRSQCPLLRSQGQREARFSLPDLMTK